MTGADGDAAGLLLQQWRAAGILACVVDIAHTPAAAVATSSTGGGGGGGVRVWARARTGGLEDALQDAGQVSGKAGACTTAFHSICCVGWCELSPIPYGRC